MPTPTTYTYDVTADFPGGKVNTSRFQTEIQASSIVTALERISSSGGSYDANAGVLTGGSIDVVFKDVLSAGDKTTLDADTTNPSGGLIAAHDNSSSALEPLRREDNILYTVPKPSHYGFVMCDRDFRVNTGIYVAADSFEDLLANPTTLLEEAWQEMAFVGVYKDDAGSMVACTDQADADANAILSVWDYCARMPGGGVQIDYELRDGALFVDPGIFADLNAPTTTERFAHRAYAIVAPGIAGNQGGSAAMFDGYLGANIKTLKVEAESPQAHHLDPNGAGGAAGAMLRLYVYYPAGSKHSHVLRLVTYRQPGTFA